MLEQITWEVAFAIVGSVLAVVGGMVKMYKNNDEESESSEDLDTKFVDLNRELEITKSRINTVVVHIENLTKIDDSLKEDMLRNSRDCVDSINKLEKKLEKVTDLMIELIKTHNN